MFDVHWLSDQARSIHDLFHATFYVLAVVLILIGVVTEYFKLPLGGGSDTSQLVVRALIAAILLQAYPEITNTISDITDAFSSRIGDLNSFHLVLTKMGDKLGELTFSWTSVKDSLILVFSFVTFFLLYISVYIADAGIVFVWTLLYIFSPLLIALYILPVTAQATGALFRALIEVSAWKIMWSVLAALLWSSALGNMNEAGGSLNFLTVISYNLILAISLLLTPLVVNALTSKGIASATASSLGLAAGAAAFSPGALAKSTMIGTKDRALSVAERGMNRFHSGLTSRVKREATKTQGARSTGSGNSMPTTEQRRIAPMSETPAWIRARSARENRNRGKEKT
jgi:hypothetical protein